MNFFNAVKSSLKLILSSCSWGNSRPIITVVIIRFFGAERVLVWVCDLSTPCCAASKAAASSQILFLVGDVLPHENMFLGTSLVQGLLVYKTVVGL